MRPLCPSPSPHLSGLLLSPPRAAVRASFLLNEPVFLSNPDHAEDRPERHSSSPSTRGNALLVAQVEYPLHDDTGSPPQIPPTPTSSPIKPFIKCATCRNINLHSLSSQHGYTHVNGWRALEQSAETCKLCTLIWKGRESSSPQKSDRNQLICSLTAINGTLIMTVQSKRPNGFRSRLAFFMTEGILSVSRQTVRFRLMRSDR